MLAKSEPQIFKRIDKFYLSHKIVRDYTMHTMNYLFYNSINTYGREKIPMNKPFMIAPNHQNAFMDAAVAINDFQRPVFIARADLFNNKYSAKFVEWGRMMPAFRIRDGKENLHKNDAIFKRSAEVLANRIPIVVFPEASHNNKRRLLPLKKGLARIAFQSEEITNFSLDLVVLPLGIYYDNYENPLGNVTAIYGDPVRVNDFKDEFLENEKRGLSLFNKKLSEEMKKVIINIENVEYYDSYETLRHFYRDEMYVKLNFQTKNPYYNLKADQALIEKLDVINEVEPEKAKELHEKVKEYSRNLKKLNFRDWQVKKEKFNSLSLYLQSVLLLLLSPISIYGFINNFLPVLPQKQIIKKVRDKQFHSSIKFVLGVLITPIIYLLQMLIVSFFTDIWWVKWIYLISLPVSLYFNLQIYRYFVKLRSSLKFDSLQKANNYNILNLITLRKEIKQNLDENIK